jgi:uncharacterized protein YcbK (DUF882 family)
VTVKAARRKLLSSHSARVGYCCSVAALLIFLGSHGLQNAVADGETRTISFHHIHTGEDLTVTYKVNGRYDEEALNKINQLLRDWRETEAVRMDPHLVDLLWEVHREVNAKEPIWVVCGYRSPQTNSMLRRRSSGVAEFSQHMLGKAVDFYIPGVALDDLRAAGLRAQRGGVGYYPTSGSPFVHLDTGNVRHWPAIPEAQLARVLAKGPLTSVAANDRGTRVAAKLPNPFAKLFGGKDEHEDTDSAAATSSSRSAATQSRPETPRAASVAAVESKSEKPVAVAAVPVPPSRPAAKPASKPATFEVASAISKPVPMRPAQASSLVAQASMSVRDIINERGFWQGIPEPIESAKANAAARSGTPARRPSGAAVAAVAAADPAVTGSVAPWPMSERNDPVAATAGALAYAPVTTPAIPSRPVPMGSAVARPAPPPVAAQPDTTVAVKRSGDRPSVVSQPGGAAASAGGVKPGERFNDPWLRAMILSPSAQGFMSTSLLGAPDYRSFAPYLQKPPASVMMTFSDDPYLGMGTDKFAGTAVVFVSTVTFNQHTASLR